MVGRVIWPYLTPREIARIILVIAILGIAIAASVFGPELRRKTNFGLGPEWDCTDPGKGSGVVCVKHPPNPGDPK